VNNDNPWCLFYAWEMSRLNHSMKNLTYFFRYKTSQAKQKMMVVDLLKQAIIPKKISKNIIDYWLIKYLFKYNINKYNILNITLIVEEICLKKLSSSEQSVVNSACKVECPARWFEDLKISLSHSFEDLKIRRFEKISFEDLKISHIRRWSRQHLTN
jgi:hypothetical protein